MASSSTVTCTITALYSYPVKSCRGTSLDTANVSSAGIEGDRQLLVVKDEKFINQVRLPKLATVATRRVDAGTIEFGLDTGDALVHDVTDDGVESTIDFYGNEVAVVDQGDELAEFVSRAIGSGVRIAALKGSFRRSVPLEEFALVDGTDQSRFVDVAPVLVTNTSSLADLNSRLEVSVPMQRFRPNIVIEGLGAFGEDDVSALEGDGWRLLRATHCERCAVTCTDQKTGERSSEPLATLASYRRRENGYAGGVMFGAYMAVQGSATIRVGDTLTVA